MISQVPPKICELLCISQTDQGLHCPLTESLDTEEYRHRKQRPGLYCAHAQDDLNLRI